MSNAASISNTSYMQSKVLTSRFNDGKESSGSPVYQWKNDLSMATSDLKQAV